MKLIDSSLPVWGKLNDAGTMTSGSVALPARGRRVAREQRLARLGQRRQHDEQIAGDHRRDQRIARQAEDLAGADRRQRGDQPGQHPEADQQRDGHIGDEIHLQPSQLLDVERARRRSRQWRTGRTA